MIELLENAGSATIGTGGTTAPAPGTAETWTGVASTITRNAVAGTSQWRGQDPAAPKEIFLITDSSTPGTMHVIRGAEDYDGLVTPVCTHAAGFTVYPVVTGASLMAAFDQAGAAAAAIVTAAADATTKSNNAVSAAEAASDALGAATTAFNNAVAAAAAAEDPAGAAAAALASALTAITSATAGLEPVLPVGGSRTISPIVPPSASSAPTVISTASQLAGALGVKMTTDPTLAGAFIEWVVNLPAGSYLVQTLLATGPIRGIVKVSLGGQVAATAIDQYSTATAPLVDTPRVVTLGTGGAQTLRLEVTGKNAAATAYNLLVSGVAISRTA